MSYTCPSASLGVPKGVASLRKSILFASSLLYTASLAFSQTVEHGANQEYFAPRGLSSSVGFSQTVFHLNSNFYGPTAYTDPAANSNYNNKMANGFSFMPPADSGMLQFLSSHPGGFVFELPGATKVAGQSAAQIESQRQAAALLCSNAGVDNSGWNAMAEWDQGGGNWVPNGRPRYTGLTRDQAYIAFTNYYLNNSPPLGTYLQQSIAQRGCKLIAQTDYSPNTFYAYKMGVDTVLLERAIDELGDTSTGIAFLRGAARQFDKQWGIDISTWRTSSDAATQFDAQGRLTGGWSPSYLRRHFYVSYLGGAQILQVEPSIYYDAAGQLNPLGAALKEFGNFALVRHPDVGRTAVSIALMIPLNSGFDTKHGLYNQYDGVWYEDIPYSSGDHMIDNLLKVAYPNHWLHGTTPNARFSNAAQYKHFLATGGDPRPYEPMPFTRWGDNLEIVNTEASSATLQQYKVVLLVGDVSLTATLRSNLQTWVQEGGTLVINSSQATSQDWSWLGIQLGATKTANDSSWSSTSTVLSEPSFSYPQVAPTTASVLATNQAGDPLITSNNYGQGRVIFTAPNFLQASSGTQLLNIGVKLIDSLNDQYALAKVNGAQLEYVVNQGTGTTIVALINNSGTTWSGSIDFKKMGTLQSAREYLSDTSVPATDAGNVINVAAQVPAYDLKVIAVQFSPDSGQL